MTIRIIFDLYTFFSSSLTRYWDTQVFRSPSKTCNVTTTTNLKKCLFSLAFMSYYVRNRTKNKKINRILYVSITKKKRH